MENIYADKENVYLITKKNCGSEILSVVINEDSGYNGTSDFDGSSYSIK